MKKVSIKEFQRRFPSILKEAPIIITNHNIDYARVYLVGPIKPIKVKPDVVLPENSLEYLKSFPEEDKKEFLAHYFLNERQLDLKVSELYNYCEMHGKQYKNYKAFLRNALSRDFKKKNTGPNEKPISKIIEEHESNI